MISMRNWGDGHSKTLEHYVGEADMHSPCASQFLECVPCSVRVTIGRFLGIDNAWQAHRGLIVSVPRLGQLATDSEVEEFLKRVADPTYTSDMSGGLFVTPPSGDLEDAFYLLDKLVDSACTCDRTSLQECPNYRDEDELP